MDLDTRAALAAADRAAAANPYAWAVAVLASTLAVGNIALGTVLATAPQRLTGPSFTYILTAATPSVWAAAFITAGTAALYGQHTRRTWPTRLSHTASAAFCAYWVGAFAYGGVADPASSLTGVVAYAIIAAAHALTAVVTPHQGSR